MVAGRATTGRPLVIKSSLDARREAEAFGRLRLNWDDEALAKHIVPLRLEQQTGSVPSCDVLVLPAMVCAVLMKETIHGRAPHVWGNFEFNLYYHKHSILSDVILRQLRAIVTAGLNSAWSLTSAKE